MKLGYSSNAFVKFSIFEAVEKIADLGFAGIEIMCDRPHLYPPDFQEKEVTELRGHIEAQGLKITNLNSFTLFAVGNTHLPSWVEPQEARRKIRIEHTLQCLRLASLLKCQNISVPPGGPLGNLSRKEALAFFLHGLEKVIPLAEKLAVKILVEPEPDLLIENTRQYKNFIREIRSPSIGLNFDIGHFFCAGEDPADSFQELCEWVGHIHVEDIAPSRIHNHLIAGHGTIDFLKVFNTLARMDYKGDMSLELYPYVETPIEAGDESLRYLFPLMQKAGLVVEIQRDREKGKTEKCC